MSDILMQEIVFWSTCLSGTGTYSQAGDIWQQILLRNFHLIHQDHTG